MASSSDIYYFAVSNLSQISVTVSTNTEQFMTRDPDNRQLLFQRHHRFSLRSLMQCITDAVHDVMKFTLQWLARGNMPAFIGSTNLVQ